MQAQRCSSLVNISTTDSAYPQLVWDSFDDAIPELRPTLNDTSTLAGDQASSESARDASFEYERFRCPVCDESYYTLEVLSAHMWANGHGRFGSVDTTSHRRAVSASATIPLAPASTAHTSSATPGALHGFSSISKVPVDAYAPSAAVPSVATALYVPTSGTASAMTAVQTATLLTRPHETAIPVSATFAGNAPMQNEQVMKHRGIVSCINCHQWYSSRKLLMQHTSVCFGRSQAPTGKTFAGVEEYLKVS